MTNSTATVTEQPADTTDVVEAPTTEVATIEAPTAEPTELELRLAASLRELEEAKAALAAKEKRAKGGNSLSAPAEQAALVKAGMDQLKDAGYTRPELQRFTGFNDSQVWRAQNEKVHTTELGTWVTLFEKFKAGELDAPAAASRKPKVEDLQVRIAELEATHAAKIKAALEALANEAKSVAQYRKVVEAAQAALA